MLDVLQKIPTTSREKNVENNLEVISRVLPSIIVSLRVDSAASNYGYAIAYSRREENVRSWSLVRTARIQ